MEFNADEAMNPSEGGGADQVTCPTCGVSVSAAEKESHEQMHAGDAVASTSEASATEETDVTCELCGESVSVAEKEAHMRERHSNGASEGGNA